MGEGAPGYEADPYVFLSINVGRRCSFHTRLLRPPHSVQAFRVHREIGNNTINCKLRNGLFSKFELCLTSVAKKNTLTCPGA
jgi:hypothetical protein